MILELQSQEKRVRLLFFLCAFGFFLVFLRLFYLQVLEHEKWQERANRQHIYQRKIIRKRGSIMDRNGNVLAYTAAVKQMICDPKKMQDPRATLEFLARYTRVPVLSLLKGVMSAKEKGRRFYLLKSDVTLDEYKRIDAKIEAEFTSLKDPNEVGLLANCVFFKDATRRYYPYNMIASNLLGFVGKDGKGLAGIEFFYEDLLKSADGLKVYERGLNGLVLPESERLLKSPEGGTSLYLSIDVVLQYLVEKRLREVFETHRPKSAQIVVQDPSNGEILAMATQPNYNPNYFSFYMHDDFKNRVISDPFEPGSTMKIFTVAAALESHAITVHDEFECKGFIELFDVFRIHCDGRKAHGILNPSQILQKSCNVGAIHIAQRLGTRRLYSFLEKFGFGLKTGIELGGETKGILRNPKQWSGLSLPALSIGQEIAVNTIQMTRAFSAIVNGGTLFHPKIITKTREVSGEEKQISVMPEGRVISKETSDALKTMLVAVTRPGGSGQSAGFEGYDVSGKTGTAQSLAEMHKSTSAWDDGMNPKVVASFLGAVPANDPKVVIYVVINEPQGEKYYGGQIAAPVFRDIARQIMGYYKIEPRKEIVLEDPDLPTRISDPVSVPSLDLIRQESRQESMPDWLKIDDSTISAGELPRVTAVIQNFEPMPDWLDISRSELGDVEDLLPEEGGTRKSWRERMRERREKREASKKKSSSENDELYELLTDDFEGGGGGE